MPYWNTKRALLSSMRCTPFLSAAPIFCAWQSNSSPGPLPCRPHQGHGQVLEIGGCRRPQFGVAHPAARPGVGGTGLLASTGSYRRRPSRALGAAAGLRRVTVRCLGRCRGVAGGRQVGAGEDSSQTVCRCPSRRIQCRRVLIACRGAGPSLRGSTRAGQSPGRRPSPRWGNVEGDGS
jgi:hypothetical protein